MKALFIFFSFLWLTVTAFGQTSKDTIVVAPGTSGMYFYHVVEKGETLQSLSQTFGVSEERLKKLNNINNSHPLKIYTLVKIPLSKNNIIQNSNAHSGLTPLYHKVLKGETLFRVSKIYGDLPLASLREWNDLNGNTIQVGQYLIIGWLKKLPDAGNLPATPPGQQNKSIAANPEEPSQPAASKPAADVAPHSRGGDRFLKEVIASERQRVSQIEDKRTSSEPVSKPLLATVQTEETPDKSSSQENEKHPGPVSQPLIHNNNVETIQKTTSPAPPVSQKEQTASSEEAPQEPSGISAAKKENPFEEMLNKLTHKSRPDSKKSPEKTTASKAEPQPKTQGQTSSSEPMPPAHETTSLPHIQKTPSTTKKDSPIALPDSSPLDATDSSTLELAQKSEFQELYLAQTQNEKIISTKKGAAGWFKSNVKPGSKKYYALCNDLPRGTIVKVINPINNKYVYVKVLASIPQQKENYNLIIKLSNAAMDDLGTHQPRFWSKIVYPKVK